MAKGYPDFLSATPFPYRGNIMLVERLAQVVVNAGLITLIYQATKSISVGGYVHVYNVTTLAGIEIFPTISVVPYDPILLTELIGRMEDKGFGIPLRLSEYNMEDNIATLLYQSGVPYGPEYTLTLRNNSGNNITVTSQFLYYEIA